MSVRKTRFTEREPGANRANRPEITEQNFEKTSQKEEKLP
jgi:hypothetical protein